jgi:hypothetical protein
MQRRRVVERLVLNAAREHALLLAAVGMGNCPDSLLLHPLPRGPFAVLGHS